MKLKLFPNTDTFFERQIDVNMSIFIKYLIQSFYYNLSDKQNYYTLILSHMTEEDININTEFIRGTIYSYLLDEALEHPCTLSSMLVGCQKTHTAITSYIVGGKSEPRDNH